MILFYFAQRHKGTKMVPQARRAFSMLGIGLSLPVFEGASRTNNPNAFVPSCLRASQKFATVQP